MKKAGEVEKQLAIERNKIINGVPYITVVADGSWVKRSYGTAYDSLSGVGAIIVCRMRPTTSCATTVKNILFPPIIDTAALKYGRDMEEIAKQDLIVKLKKEVKSCGLFIDCDNPWLGATPDGLLDEDGLVEIKYPLSTENLTAEKATETVPRLKNIFDKRNGNMMNKNHHYFYQIQGQLNITQREYCIFAV
ncbi:hypothetical protein ALC62_00740 [Cyphomyrmex costatus]|uniref:Uncharacterized protein n=1 Tax=Cyphomyrmex costatus TaxID=456900 RepID=A0A151IQ47_9HYME|nr:hypothetical protein ALC62_00740 [Cyphomyrmex costatus]